MSWRRQFSKIEALLHRRKSADDIEEEIRSHLTIEEQENLASGMPPEEAHYAAIRRFGNVTGTQEKSREMWGWNSLEMFSQDLRFGVRQLKRNPGFAIVAILTLALGIGATTAIFSVVNSVLLRPLPYKDPDRLVRFFETEEAPGNFPLSGADYLDWQAQNQTFEAMSLYSWPSSMSAGGAGEPESVAVASTQANFFDVLGVTPLRGRAFATGEDTAGKNRVAVLSYGFWQRHFGGGAHVIGRSVVIDNQTYTVIGIMPGWFSFQAATDVWIPLEMSLKELGPHGNHRWNAVGRLRKDVTLAQARQDLLAISERLEKQYPKANYKVHATVTPLRDTLVGDSRAPLLILLGAVTLVLLIACVNVANLQLARASARHREMAVRSSLGAGRLRLVRQMLTESILLALAGAAAGVLAAAWCVHVLQAVKTLPVPRANPIQIDGMVLLFAIGISVLAGILFGLAPAFQNSEMGLNEELKAGAQSVLNAAQGRRLLRDGLIVAEISFTLALLVGAGLLLRSFAHLRAADIGIKTQNVVTAALNLPETKYPTLAARRQFFDQLAERIRNSPGVSSAAMSTEIPLEGGSNGYIKVDEEADPTLSSQLVGWNFITPDYFRTLSIPLLKGRNFTEQDLNRAGITGQKLYELYKAAQGSQMKVPPDSSFVAIISQTMAQTFWRNRNPVGRSFHWNDSKVVVIGVVGDVKEYGIRAKAIPQVYFPLPLALPGFGFGYLTVKTSMPSTAVLGTMRNHVRALDPNLALLRPQTMDEVIAGNTRDATVQTFLLGTFAILALILAAIGLYGVMSYLVSRRTREIGVRMALGAQRSNVLRLILIEGTKLTFIGMLLGAIAAFALTRWMSSLLYGVGPQDPLSFVCAAVLLALVSLAAYYFPAYRASKIDPVLALRYE